MNHAPPFWRVRPAGAIHIPVNARVILWSLAIASLTIGCDEPISCNLKSLCSSRVTYSSLFQASPAVVQLEACENGRCVTASVRRNGDCLFPDPPDGPPFASCGVQWYDDRFRATVVMSVLSDEGEDLYSVSVMTGGTTYARDQVRGPPAKVVYGQGECAQTCYQLAFGNAE